jgi:hypothetical protein
MRRSILFYLCPILLITSSMAFAIQETAPPDKDYLIIPGRSLGKIQLGMKKEEVLKLLGKPSEQTPKPSLIYRSKSTNNYIEMHLIKSEVQQIDFTSNAYKTEGGIDVNNYADDEFKKIFFKWRIPLRFINLKYTLNSGGLTFYIINADSADSEFPPTTIGVIHPGLKPKYEALYIEGAPNNGWKAWGGGDIYSD